jgi:octaprenyl-diphosphate synthase
MPEASRPIALMHLAPMDLDQVNALVARDMTAVDEMIHQRLQSQVMLINQLSHYIVNSGGKRLRPMLVLLAAGACGYQGRQHIDMAAIIEFIHTATLLHDDVVDGSELRRGHETVNAIWGNESSVLVGDYLYSRAFEMMVDIGSMRIMEILSHVTTIIAEGEVMQLLNCRDADITEARYMKVIQSKTAKLFEAAGQTGAVLAAAPARAEQALASYGMHLGTAFQLIDDALDYSASSEQLGKTVGADLADGKPTLPLIYAMHQGSSEQARIIRHAIERGGVEQIDAIPEAIESTGAIAYTEDVARRAADNAIEQLGRLPDSDHKQALIALARFSANRSF